MTCLFTVFGPRHHEFKNNDSKMIDVGANKECIYSSFSIFNVLFFLIVNSLQYYIILS